MTADARYGWVVTKEGFPQLAWIETESDGLTYYSFVCGHRGEGPNINPLGCSFPVAYSMNKPMKRMYEETIPSSYADLKLYYASDLVEPVDSLVEKWSVMAKRRKRRAELRKLKLEIDRKRYRDGK